MLSFSRELNIFLKFPSSRSFDRSIKLWFILISSKVLDFRSDKFSIDYARNDEKIINNWWRSTKEFSLRFFNKHCYEKSRSKSPTVLRTTQPIIMELKWIILYTVQWRCYRWLTNNFHGNRLFFLCRKKIFLLRVRIKTSANFMMFSHQDWGGSEGRILSEKQRETEW